MDPATPLYPQKLGQFYLEDVVGQGNTCIVVKARDANNRKYACKIISKLKFTSVTNIKHFHDELKIMRTLSHPNIVNLVDIIQDSNNLYIFEEFCELGDLSRMLVRDKSIPDDRIGQIFSQIVKGLNFIHEHRIAHRDIKPENIFMCENGLVKIADFGYSALNSDSDFRSTVCGTLVYIAPEILEQKPYNALKADSWSCGILLYAMASGKFPWEKKSQAGMIEEIKFKPITIPESVSPEIKDLISHLLDRNVETRFTMAQALQSEFIKKYLNVESPSPPTGNISHQLKNQFSKSALNFSQIKEESIVNMLNMANRKPPKILSKKPKILTPIIESNSTMKLTAMVNTNKIKCRSTMQNTFGYNTVTGNFEL